MLTLPSFSLEKSIRLYTNWRLLLFREISIWPLGCALQSYTALTGNKMSHIIASTQASLNQELIRNRVYYTYYLYKGYIPMPICCAEILSPYIFKKLCNFLFQKNQFPSILLIFLSWVANEPKMFRKIFMTAAFFNGPLPVLLQLLQVFM